MWALVMGLSAIVVLLSVRWLLVPRVSNYMAGTTPSSNQDRPRWRQRHAKLTARLYLILGPLVAAGFAWFLPARGKWRAVLEAVTGNWPNGDAISTHWLAVCVGLIVFVTVGVPILLGSYVNDMIKASEVRITNMRLEELLTARPVVKAKRVENSRLRGREEGEQFGHLRGCRRLPCAFLQCLERFTIR